MTFPKRVLRDLGADYRKTLFMVLLMGVFIYAWLPILTSKGKKDRADAEPEYTIMEVESGNPLLPPENREMSTKARTVKSFLAKALPFEEINTNPFRSLRKPEKPAENGEDLDALKANAEALAQKERQILETIKITCTLRSSGKSAVVIDGEIYEEGSTYKGFLIEKVEEGFVTFTGKEIQGYRVEVPF